MTKKWCEVVNVVSFGNIVKDISDICDNMMEKRKMEIQNKVTKLDNIVEIGIALGIIKSNIDRCYYLEYGDNEDVFFMYLDLCVGLWKQYYDEVNKTLL